LPTSRLNELEIKLKAHAEANIELRASLKAKTRELSAKQHLEKKLKRFKARNKRLRVKNEELVEKSRRRSYKTRPGKFGVGPRRMMRTPGVSGVDEPEWKKTYRGRVDGYLRSQESKGDVKPRASKPRVALKFLV
jgi:hypothetical protein